MRRGRRRHAEWSIVDENEILWGKEMLERVLGMMEGVHGRAKGKNKREYRKCAHTMKSINVMGSTWDEALDEGYPSS